ncbi:MAG: hypothetical protein A2Y66_01810 [Nitrospirae bacterium RBG_13_41_22]|nr:MAG: hypothetical protein A2Y66_01810 [Nitrospirae bacterium RBG_13_41_22]
MEHIAGTFNGTGAGVYLCFGFVPDWVKIQNYETSNDYMIEWNRNMHRSGEFVEGMQIHTGTTYRQITALTKGAGILPYKGGVVLNATTAGTTTYAEGVYLKPDTKDYRYITADSPHGVGDAVANTINSWTLGSAANYTGNFNADVTGTYIGEGSKIMINGITYYIVALTAGQGISANEVTLSQPAPTGDIQSIGGMYDMAPMVSGETTLAGIYIANTTVNVNNALIGFEAGTWK